MKRNLNRNQYQLGDRERENVWQAIRRETHGPAAGHAPRGAIRPVLAFTAVAATVALMVVWQLGSRQAGPGPALPDAHGGDVRIAEIPAAAAAPRSGPVLTGRILDKESGEPLAYANVRIRGTTFAAMTDSLGVFRFENLPPGRKIELAVDMLSYAPVEVAIETPTTGVIRHDFDLEPVVVATLQTFEVEGAEYMVEVKSGVREHKAQNREFDKYAGPSTEEALNRKAGIVMRAGEPSVRGGRSGEVHLRIDGVQDSAPRTVRPLPGPGSITGGTTPPNGDRVELMYFESAGVNPFVATEDDNLSTFAVDVDNASWTLARNYLSRGMLPPKDAIRVEEFVNAFDAGWPHHTDQPFRIHADGAASRFGKGYHLLRIGLVGQDVDDSRRKPANLVFVVDVSGSMDRENRLGLVKQALHVLLDELGEGDRVGLVVYGSQGEVRLPLTDLSRREQIVAAIDGLRSGGSTNAAEGLQLAYRMARASYDAGIINRLILCSDGVANDGVSTEAGGILDIVRRASDEGITLSTIGFGLGNYNDVLLEKLADQGDGNYYYVDKLAEAERVFRENLTSLLQTIAREVKVQVEFNPEIVQRWRLLGYENRDVADEDFRNDQVDAGEVGAGHQVTALYELKLKAAASEADKGRGLRSPVRIGTVHLRHEAPAHDAKRAGKVTEIEQAVLASQLAADYSEGTSWLRVQTVVAEFAEILRGSYWAKGNTLAELVPVADALARELSGDQRVQDLARMIRQAADLGEAGQ
jgi:Ca-activated chloride channel family protein